MNRVFIAMPGESRHWTPGYVTGFSVQFRHDTLKECADAEIAADRRHRKQFRTWTPEPAVLWEGEQMSRNDVQLVRVVGTVHRGLANYDDREEW